MELRDLSLLFPARAGQVSGQPALARGGLVAITCVCAVAASVFVRAPWVNTTAPSTTTIGSDMTKAPQNPHKEGVEGPPGSPLWKCRPQPCRGRFQDHQLGLVDAGGRGRRATPPQLHAAVTGPIRCSYTESRGFVASWGPLQGAPATGWLEGAPALPTALRV